MQTAVLLANSEELDRTVGHFSDQGWRRMLIETIANKSKILVLKGIKDNKSSDSLYDEKHKAVDKF